MADEKMSTVVIPPYLIRAYVWALLQVNTDMKPSDYNGLNPIVPLGEEPEINQFDKPHIVWGYAETTSPDLPGGIRGNIAFVVYSTNTREMNKIVNVITRALDDDDSAQHVNDWTSKTPGFIGIRFGNISASYVEGGSPEETEGGKMSASINISYECYVEYNIQQP